MSSLQTHRPTCKFQHRTERRTHLHPIWPHQTPSSEVSRDLVKSRAVILRKPNRQFFKLVIGTWAGTPARPLKKFRDPPCQTLVQWLRVAHMMRSVNCARYWKTVSMIEQSAKIKEDHRLSSRVSRKAIIIKTPDNCKTSDKIRKTSERCSTPFALRSAPESCSLRAHPAIQLARCRDHAGKGSRVRVVMKRSAENTKDVSQVQVRQLVMSLRRSCRSPRANKKSDTCGIRRNARPRAKQKKLALCQVP